MANSDMRGPSTSQKMRARQNFLPLATPQPDPGVTDQDRDSWIEQTCAEFVAPSKANRAYYRVLLETLWPKGHGIPGPRISEGELRDAINTYRRSVHDGKTPYKEYVDVFRRVRELAGEEGVIGIARIGRVYQLVDLKVSEKRVPRVSLSAGEWNKILEQYHHKCAVCGRSSEEVEFDQDHKIPRVRGGGDQVSNWQPLCGECNNHKSTSCRGCVLDCSKCAWAYPEKYAPIKLGSEAIIGIRQSAERKGIPPHELLGEIVAAYLTQADEL